MSIETHSAQPQEVMYDFPRISVLDQYAQDRRAGLERVNKGLSIEIPTNCEYEEALALLKPISEDALSHMNGSLRRSNEFGKVFGSMLNAIGDLGTAVKSDKGTKLVLRKNSIIEDQEIRTIVTLQGKNPEKPEKITIYPAGVGFEFSLVLTRVSGYTTEIKALEVSSELNPGEKVTLVKDSIHKGTDADLHFAKKFVAGLKP